jgi:hypothetical protein
MFESEMGDLSVSAVAYALVAVPHGCTGTCMFFSPEIHEAVVGIARSVAFFFCRL